MKLEQIREAYYGYSGKVSDQVRQLNLAGIAIVWLFRIDKENVIALPMLLRWSLVLLVISLCFDFAHYFVNTIIWGRLGHSNEKFIQKHLLDRNAVELDIPEYVNWPGNIFFYGKSATLICGYILLLCFLGILLSAA